MTTGQMHIQTDGWTDRRQANDPYVTLCFAGNKETEFAGNTSLFHGTECTDKLYMQFILRQLRCKHKIVKL